MDNPVAEKYFVWPFTKLPDGSYTMPDEFLHAIWKQLAADGNAHRVFYDGAVKTAEDFARFMKLPGNYPVFVMDPEKQKIVFAAWLNGVSANAAYAHFFGLGRGSYRPELSNMIVGYWEKMNLFSVILGVLPAQNSRAIHVAVDCGFEILGAIPGLCLKADGNVEAGTILYRPMMREKEKT
ncbi:MAG: hypothetical protein QMD11_02680 [Smithella sp.]|nr:hypothetical protein [Smithella sp.]